MRSGLFRLRIFYVVTHQHRNGLHRVRYPRGQ
jgi:hypothetical protein